MVRLTMIEPAEIHVLDHKVRLLQPPRGFRTALDSVLLAASCPAMAGERVLDLGCGVGSAAFCLLWRVAACGVTGLEIQDDHVELAWRNAALNECTGRCEFITGDVRTYDVVDPAARFDHVLCNPPYLEEGRHLPSPEPSRAMALGHQEAALSLKDWLDGAFRNLRPGGSLTLIHRADQLDRVIQSLGKRFGALEIIPLWPRAGVAAKRVIVRARKGRLTPAMLHAGLTLHEADGHYTAAADAILRDGQALL